ncbi:MAG TPA: YncE family protein [Chitinophagaceae bacterium]|jgi:YVTN family beta-propeller protein
MKRLLFLLLAAPVLIPVTVGAQTGGKFHIVKTFPIASSGGWDYIAVGPGNNRIYVSHGTQVNVLDATTGDSVGFIPNTTGVHGIAFVPALGKGYTSNGRINNVSVFDLKTNQVTGQIATGTNPDAIMYDGFTKTIITCNGRSNDLSVIDPVAEKVIATIPVGGKPETAVSDNAGHVFVNIEDKSEIVCVDMKSKTVEKRWPLAPAEGPTGLAIDIATKRLFAGCDKLLVVLDATTGAVVSKLPIADGCDGVAFDNKLKTVFASCGEGKLTVIHEASASVFTVTDNVATKKSARTLAVDEATHTVYLPAAEFEATTPAGARRPPMVPGTFQVLVVKQ